MVEWRETNESNLGMLLAPRNDKDGVRWDGWPPMGGLSFILEDSPEHRDWI